MADVGRTFTGNAWNGIAVDKAATVVIANCTVTDNGKGGDSKRGYGILRQRAPGNGWPAAITLITNVLAENHGLIVAGRSTAQLGNFDQVIDPLDLQSSY